MSGVKFKFKSFLAAAAAACLCVPLCACSVDLKNPYNLQNLSLSHMEPGEAYLAKGFASDLCIPGNYEELEAEGIEAESFALFSLDDGQVLSQKGIYDRVYPASTTKILTCLVALEHGDLSDTVTVPEEARITVSGSSMADLKVGDQLSLQDLLYGLMIPSGNDAAAAVAVYIAGSEEAFAEMMNETGFSYGQYKAYYNEGFYNTAEEVANHPYNSIDGNKVHGGDLRIVDVNGDGQIDNKDMTPTGFSNIPRFAFSGNLRLGYKGFEISALFTGSDESPPLSKVAEEIAHHPGNVWLPIISLRREENGWRFSEFDVPF